MTTAAPAFSKKTIYHSELVKAGPLYMMFTGPVRDSKYAGKPAYITFKAQQNGEETEHTYNVENDTVREELDNAPKNVWLQVRATGSREEAWLALEDANGNPVLKGTPVRDLAQPKDGIKTSGPQAPPANEWRKMDGPHPEMEQPTDETDPLRARLADRYYLALEAANDATQKFAKAHDGLQPSDAVRNIATTIFIQASGR